MCSPFLTYQDFGASAGRVWTRKGPHGNCFGCNVHLSFVFLKIINVNVIIIYIFLWKISPKYKLLCKL